MSETVTTYRVQYCRDGMETDHDMYADEDADTVRVWEGNHEAFVLGEFKRERDSDGAWSRWSYTGGDSMLSDAFKDDSYRDLDDILAALCHQVGPLQPAVCRCGQGWDVPCF